MPQKHVVVTFHTSPIGRNGCVEGLRAAVGLTAGTEENSVACVFLGDAVLFALPSAERTDAQKHLDALAGMGASLLVDVRALEARGLRAGDVAAPFRVAPQSEIADILRSAEATVAF